MIQQSRVYLLSALLVVPFMMGNRGCESNSQDSKPEADEGSLDQGSATSDDAAMDGANQDGAAASDMARDAGAVEDSGVDAPSPEPTGAFCGGIAGIPCKDGEYCDFAGHCGATDQGGECASITDNCTFEYNPVCGCDDKTYSNACAAASASVSVLHAGACDEPQPCSSCAGPAPGAPNYQCKDGVHVGGPACVAQPGAKCGWQFLQCPEEIAAKQP